MSVELTSLFVSVASLGATILLGRNSIEVSERSLSQAREVACQSRDDWRQQQWFALFIEANSAYDLVDRYQAKLKELGGFNPAEAQHILHDATLQIRKTHSLAVVFPKCPQIDALFKATEFQNHTAYQSQDKLKLLASVLGDLAVMARVSTAVVS